jgi:hypothetical protein
MRIHRWILHPLFFCLSLALAYGQVMMTDPLCGISYDPQTVHFEKLPARLVKLCPDLRGRYVAAWTYGSFKANGTEYFLLSGLMEFHEEKPRGARSIAPDEGDGLVAAIQGSKCIVDQTGYFLMQTVNTANGATAIMVPRPVVTGVLQDAFKRYVVAFGSKEEFLKHVKAKALLPIVREELESFEREPSN